jgi:drug/metabolite transporter (DMT)-like permease
MPAIRRFLNQPYRNRHIEWRDVATFNLRQPGLMTQQASHIKTYLLIGVIIIAAPLGNVFLGKGMKAIGTLAIWPPAELLHAGAKILGSGSIWLGIALLMTFFAAYMLVLSWADYSFVQPASSLSYGVVALFSYLLLGEHVSPMRWAGIAVICLGVFVVGRTNPKTTTHRAETA